MGDKQMMLDFSGMVCFIKRYPENGEIESGLLLNPTNCRERMSLRTQVYGWVPVDIANCDPWAGVLPPFNEAKVIDVDDLINDGWMVD